MGETTPPYAPREVHRQSATRTIYEVHEKQKKSNGNKNIQFQHRNALVSTGVKPINCTYIVHKLYTFRHDEPIENQP